MGLTPAHLGLIFLLAVELLALSVRFDTQAVSAVSSYWAQSIGLAPQIVRLALSVAVAGVLLAVARRRSTLASLDPGPNPWRGLYLALHVLALVAFVLLSRRVIDGAASAAISTATFSAWTAAGVATAAAWCAALCAPASWRGLISQERQSIGWGILAGTLTWASGFVTQELWRPLAHYTFALVTWMLGFVYPNVVSDAGTLMVGTRTFKVIVTPACSGAEGIGLILAFLSAYLWLYRRDVRFPQALILLPLGALTIWLANALRLVALVAIGSAGWREVAKGGFHSQAGWIAFVLIALGFVAVTMKFRLFRTDRRPAAASAPASADATAAYLAPFVAVTAAAMITGALSGGFEWFYPLRVVAVGVVLWMFRARYLAETWRWSWSPVLIGAAAFLVWIALIPADARAHQGWPDALRSVPWYWATLWILFRTAGYVVAAPLAEELAFRGFLRRWIVRSDFERVPMGVFTWGSFLLSSVLFGAFHGSLWLAGTVAGMLFAVAVYRRGTLADSIQAHATANGLIALYAWATGQWNVWS